MKRQQNSYRVEGFVTVLEITQLNGNVIKAYLETEHYDAVKRFKWAFRGKSGIFNEFNVSLGTFIAEKLGYKASNWRRIDASTANYMQDNYSERLTLHGRDVPNWRPISAENRGTLPVPVAMEQKFFERMRWQRKTQCEVFKLRVFYGRTMLDGCIEIQCNTYLRQFIPTEVRIHDEHICLLDGTRLDKHIIVSAGGVPDEAQCVSRTYTGRTSGLDYRIDPTTIQYAATVYSHKRLHRIDVDGKACIVLELRENAKTISDYPYKEWHTDSFICPRMPSEPTDTWRYSYVMFDAKALPHLETLSNDLMIFYAPSDMEWIIVEDTVDSTGEKYTHWRQLKRELCHAMGISVEHEYFAPRMTKAYAAALKASEESESFGIADQRRAKFENADGSSRAKMFTKPKTIRHRKIIADKQYFCTQIYGGVGIWVKDLRSDSMLVKTNAALKEIVLDSNKDAHRVKG